MAASSRSWFLLSCPRCGAAVSWYGLPEEERPQHRCAKDHKVRGFGRETPMRAPAKAH